MKVSDFDYELPESMIAQKAVEPRDASRLMVLHRKSESVEHRTFRDMTEYLREGDLLVLNQTKVIPARLHGHKTTGGAAEILLLRPLDEAATRWLALVGARNPRPGVIINLPGVTAEIVEEREHAERVVQFSAPILGRLSELGETPLPPYIHEPIADPDRYQTVYAREPGSSAAPTAGLHFTPDLLIELRRMGIDFAYCTLHIGLGTFQPVHEEDVEDHVMHAEYAVLAERDARAINEAKLAGRRVIAVGTTSVRTLETAAIEAIKQVNGGDPCGDVCPWKPVAAFAGDTSLFITPGFPFRAVDALITNFHLPRSTLLMLVSAFAGREFVLDAYKKAVREGYRFYSLGDAMLIV